MDKPKKDDRKFGRKGGKRPFNKREPKERENEVPKICMNDPTWYVVHPELLKDVASLSFPEWIGRGFKGSSGHANQAIALGLRYVYTLGVSTNADSPANLAVRNMYTFVRHANSGHANYESSDLGLYLFEVGAIIATLAHIERILGVAKYYQVKNSAVPAALLSALGVSNWSTVLIPNLANYTARLNIMWTRLSSLCIPKDFKFIERWIWMNSQVFKDHESRKSQLLVFVPCGVPKFVVNATLGGYIKQENYKTRLTTIDDWFNEASLALDLVLGDEDMNIMSGDILKAYGEERLYKFGMTPLDYIVEPRFVEEMLPQIENLRTAPYQSWSGGNVVESDVVTVIPREVGLALGSDFAAMASLLDDRDAFIIYQTQQSIISTPSFNYGATSATSATDNTFWCDTSLSNIYIWGNVAHDIIINSKHEVPTPEDVMISTRLTYTETAEATGSSCRRYISSCGTELVIAIDVKASDLGYNTSFEFRNEILLYGPADQTTILRNMCVVNQFDWAPITYLGKLTASPTTPVAYWDLLAGDLDNYTFVAADRLEAMHLNAILGEFNVSNLNFIK